MTTSPVPSITDEQIAEIERFLSFGGSMLKVKSAAIQGLIARLRAAERDAGRVDFLEKHPNWLRYNKGRYSCVLPGTNYSYRVYATARDAIDAAMTEAKP